LHLPFVSLSCASLPTSVPSPLSLHDALPISSVETADSAAKPVEKLPMPPPSTRPPVKIAAGEESKAMPASLIAKTETARSEVKSDRKSTRLNSSHQIISYAVFCLKKKKKAHK